MYHPNHLRLTEKLKSESHMESVVLDESQTGIFIMATGELKSAMTHLSSM